MVTENWGRQKEPWNKATPSPSPKKPTEKELFDLNKAEQIAMLKEAGVSDDVIKTLSKEQDRVNKLMEVL